MAALLRRPKDPEGDPKRRRKFTGDPEDYRLTLVEHLDELRQRIIRSLVILTAAWVVGWVIFPSLYDHLDKLVTHAIQPVLKPGIKLSERFDTVTEPFMLKLQFSFLVGLFLSLPLLVLQLWGFIEPGLKPGEAKPIRRLAPVSILLFLMGSGFSWAILPSALRWFATYVEEFPGTDMILHAGTMVFFVMKMLIAFGISFQLPLVVYILGALNLLSADTLIKYWRHGATAIFVIAMIITPSNDPGSMLAMAIPLVILFMISVYVVRIVQRRRPVVKDPYDDNEAA